MSPLIVVVVVLGAVAISIGLLVLLRRRAPEGWWVDPGRAAGVLGAARSPFAVILAFVILVAFQGFNDAKQGAQQEASATRTLFKTASLLQPAVRDDLHANLLCYARAVVSADWPAMGHGGTSTLVDDLAGQIEDGIGQIRTTDDVQRAAVGDIFDEANARERARDARLAEAQGRVPSPVWIVILMGGAGVLAYVLLFADPRERFVSQAVMVGSVTTIIVGGLVLVYFLSHPYRDEPGSIRPTAMRHTIDVIEHDTHFTEGGFLHRCDAQGRPL
jgi:hypothetical protein